MLFFFVVFVVDVFFLVLQLVKSQKEHIKLILETEKEKILRKEFLFENTKVANILEGYHPFKKMHFFKFIFIFFIFQLWVIMCKLLFYVLAEERRFLPTASTDEEQTFRKA